MATALPAEAVYAQDPDGFGGPLAPDFLRHPAGRDGRTGTVDAVLVAPGTRPPPHCRSVRTSTATPGVRHARELRTEVRVHADERGLVTLAAGLAGRREMSVELHDPERGSSRRGRSLLEDALALVPDGEPVFAAVAPGNARSLRAVLAAGFVPLGSESIIRPQRPATT